MQCSNEVDDDLFALAANDNVHRIALTRDLLVHKGGMDSTEDPERRWDHFARNLQHTFGRIDGRRDCRCANQVGLQFVETGPQLLIRHVVGHCIQEVDVVETGVFQHAGQVGNPRRRPVSGDFGAAGMVIRVHKDNAHASSP